jgi:glucokinase
MSDSPYFAGLDIGGSTIKSLLIDAQASPVGPLVEIPSLVQQGFRRTFLQLHECLKLLSEETGIAVDAVRAVGLDVPAPCSKGVIWGKANLAQDWVGTNIEQEFAREISKPVVMTNDGNAAAYGEWLYRKGREGGLLFVAPGTGLGGGLVLPGGHMYEGTNGLALEVSDITVPFEEDDGSIPADALGRERCLEAWVSLVGLRRTLQIKLNQERHANHPLNREDSTLVEKAFQLRDYAGSGDPLAVEIFKRQAYILGYGLADLTSLFDPGLIVIGGGLAETTFRDWYLEAVEEGFHQRAAPFYRFSPLPPHAPTTAFEWAIGGDKSAAYGAARRVMDLV